MLIQNSLRNSLLLLINITVASATIYLWLEPEAGNRRVSSFIFPEQVSINNWQQTQNGSLPTKLPINLAQKSELIKSVKHYQYAQNDLTLDAKIFYIVNTRGNVNQLIETYTNIEPNNLKQQQVKKQQDIGTYLLFHDRDRAYLSSCLNASGTTTVTPQQFSENLNQVRLTPKLLGNWLLGKASIRDRRCLWLHLSIPLQSDINRTYAILENTWIDLSQWWIPQFPPL